MGFGQNHFLFSANTRPNNQESYQKLLGVLGEGVILEAEFKPDICKCIYTTSMARWASGRITFCFWVTDPTIKKVTRNWFLTVDLFSVGHKIQNEINISSTAARNTKQSTDMNIVTSICNLAE